MNTNKEKTANPFDLSLPSVDAELDGPQAVELAHGQLKDIFHSRGRGSVSRVEDTLGYSRDTISQWRRRGYLPFGQLVDMLRSLRYSPVSFFAELFRSEPADKDRTSDDRLRLAQACAEADELRHTDPIAALRILNDVHHLSELAPALYAGAAGSAFRVLQMSTEAGTFLTTALMSTAETYLLADIHRRLAPYYHQCRNDPERALSHLNSSTQLFESIGACHEAKKNLATLIIVSYETGQPRDLILPIAHELLQWPSCPIRSRITTYQTLAALYHREANHEEATSNCLSAISLATDPFTRGHLHWQLSEMTRPPVATDHFREAVSHFGSTFPYQTILCTLESVGRLGLSPSLEFRNLTSFNFDFQAFNTLAQDLAAAADLQNANITRRLPSDLPQKLYRAWTSYRQAQARLAASTLLANTHQEKR